MKRKYLMFGAAVCAALFLFSGFMLCREYYDQKQSKEAFENVAKLVKTVPDEYTDAPEDESAAPEAPASEPQTPEAAVPAYEKYAKVYAANSDCVGWISIPGTRIDYPVMQTKDNPNYYLKHSFEKSHSDYGVPYVQENCAVGLSDNTIMYGHHMNNGSMFSDLCKYTDKAFYNKHKTIRFDTLDGYGEYEVVTVFKTAAYSEQGFPYYGFVEAYKKEEFDGYVAKCKELSLYDTGVAAAYGDKLITLSTCEYSQENGRLVVVAKKVSK